MKPKKYKYTVILNIFLIISLPFYANSMVYEHEAMEDAKVVLSFSEENGSKLIKATVTDQEGQPIEELDLYFYVKRTFSLLPIGDAFNTTDKNGVVTVQFPNDLPGDAQGNVTIVVKIIESDLYNDLTLEMNKKWGIQTYLDQSLEERSLWSAAANAPISLVLSVSVMIIAVWYIIFNIIFKLYKMSKIRTVIS